ncbi:MmgE/PrpD family protein [Actinacidiphila sp. DG2A-62]|uniref:MmgE/PrpD family protein n=1 Tax=Actinacidiphila sp. DG2A-62 TaxID=3108821 RepID=UPI002DBCDBB1|nr:MmgE/PrpD family protein [Actinacidiphila sp. DG2A-62]MEC3993742.1 MmgE/PrpD family protein [Actinacidiphila sp. DG2A-62]
MKTLLQTSPPPPRSTTAVLATAVCRLRFEDLPPRVVALARHCLLDVLGAMLAGAREPAARILADFTASEIQGGPCTLVGMPGTAAASSAALVNGAAGHALDFDDVISTVGHPSVAVAPAALAVAERTGASGRALLTAFVAGVEAEARVAEAVGPAHYARGFHSTATFGSFGAAAAVAHLLGLDAARTTTALAIAGTQAAGLKAVFGTMSKPLHAGRAAANGVVAGELAMRGFTSADDILGHPQGFAAAESDVFDPRALSPQFGDPWRLEEVRFKTHASCFLTHASINALIALREHDGFGLGDVERIAIAVPPGHLDVCGIAEPRTGLEAKFSLTGTAALALIHRRATPDLFTDAATADPAALALRERTAVVPDPSLSGPVAAVRVALRDGRELRSVWDMRAPAWSEDPAERDRALTAKFTGLAEPVIGPERAALAADAVAGLAGLDDVRVLCRQLRA